MDSDIPPCGFDGGTLLGCLNPLGCICGKHRSEIAESVTDAAAELPVADEGVNDDAPEPGAE